MDISPVTLDGTHVRLEPLSMKHLDGLCAVGLDTNLWQFTTTHIRTAADMKMYVETVLQWQADGKALPFAIIDKLNDTVAGSTRYAAIEKEHRRLEIGWTWIARAWQRTAVNTEAKYLLLKHAFDQLQCIRVEFKTDSRNNQSRRALLRIGAREEGILRHHMILPSGGYRDSVYFSIIDTEWPEVRLTLEGFLGKKNRMETKPNSTRKPN